MRIPIDFTYPIFRFFLLNLMRVDVLSAMTESQILFPRNRFTTYENLA